MGKNKYYGDNSMKNTSLHFWVLISGIYRDISAVVNDNESDEINFIFNLLKRMFIIIFLKLMYTSNYFGWVFRKTFLSELLVLLPT